MGKKRGKEKKARKPIPMAGLFLYFGLTVFHLETFLKTTMNGHVFYSGILISLLFGTVFAVVLAGVITALPLRARKAVSATVLFVVCLLFASQVVYYSIFQNFYTAYSAGNAGKVMEFVGEAWYAIKINAVRILVAFIPFILFLVLSARRAFEGRLNGKRIAILLAVLVVAQSLGLGLVNLDDRGEVSPYQMYYNVQHPEMAVSQLGLLTYMRLDTQRSLLSLEPVRLRVEPTRQTMPTTAPAPTTTAPATQPSGTVEPTDAPAPEYNVLDMDFDALMAGTDDPGLKELDAYFQSVAPTEKNDHTGRYEGYNLIFITAEAFSHLAVREDVTPTLYKMMHEGCLFTNFYTSYWGVSTSDGEYVATTSLVPKSGAWSYSQSSDNAMPFAMGNQLKTLGYKTLAYHNHSYDYYDRDRSHPNMGYDFKGIGNGLDVTPVWPASDLEMMTVTIPDFIYSEPFHTYYMTVSGHLRYNFYGNNMAMKNQALVADLSFSEPVRAYLATQIELDRAMEHLLNELEQAGVADRTLIAMSADHYPYGLTYEENEELAGHSLDPDFELYHNAFILYSADMEPERIDTPASSLDILPTLQNLMGLPYDSRLLMGRDLFSNAPPLVFFYDRSFITDKGRYNAKTNVFTPVEQNGEASDQDWEAYREYVSAAISEKFRVSAEVLDLDYYAHALPDGIGNK